MFGGDDCEDARLDDLDAVQRASTEAMRSAMVGSSGAGGA
jgi:hypothetical protein